MHRTLLVLLLLVAVAGVAACGSSDGVDVAPAEPEAASEAVEQEEPPVIDGERFPTVVDVTATPTGTGDAGWRFDVTLSSPYDTPERYADAWRVLDADGNELGIRVLTHDHADEQPFTRSTTIDIPPGVERVFVEGRDQANGWSGERFEVTLER